MNVRNEFLELIHSEKVATITVEDFEAFRRGIKQEDFATEDSILRSMKSYAEEKYGIRILNYHEITT